MNSDSSEPDRIKVRVSAPLELMWVVHDCEASHALEGPLASLESLRARLGPELRTFWDDGFRGFTEAVVLAERSGTMLDLDLDRFFARLDGAAASAEGVPSLLSETPAERRALEARLDRLRLDPELRERYRSLLLTAWEWVRPEWESEGKPAVVRAAADWTRRLAEGVPFRSLLERQRIWPGRAELEALADEAGTDGTMILSPGWFYGVIHVVEMRGVIYLGRRIRTEDEGTARREVAKVVSVGMKALADPTRLNIVMWLAGHPASITEIARQFKLSQPTVSGHVQLLREAGLVEERPSGRSSQLTVTEARLRELLAKTQEALLRQFPHD